MEFKESIIDNFERLSRYMRTKIISDTTFAMIVKSRNVEESIEYLKQFIALELESFLRYIVTGGSSEELNEALGYCAQELYELSVRDVIDSAHIDKIRYNLFKRNIDGIEKPVEIDGGERRMIQYVGLDVINAIHFNIEKYKGVNIQPRPIDYEMYYWHKNYGDLESDPMRPMLDVVEYQFGHESIFFNKRFFYIFHTGKMYYALIDRTFMVVREGYDTFERQVASYEGSADPMKYVARYSIFEFLDKIVAPIANEIRLREVGTNSDYLMSITGDFRPV